MTSVELELSIMRIEAVILFIKAVFFMKQQSNKSSKLHRTVYNNLVAISSSYEEC